MQNRLAHPFASDQGKRRLAPGTIFLSALFLLFQANLSQLPAASKSMDGFFAYCTSNLDTTGECVNEEDGRKISCLIVPGQIISCPTSASRSMECVWISGITASQAQFWCDREDEAALYGAALDSPLPETFDNETLDELNSGDRPGLNPSANDSIFENSF